jgi:hypothetical protein
MFGIDDSACQRLQVCYIDLRLGTLLSVIHCSTPLPTEQRPRALLRTCLRHAHDGANSRSLSPSSNQKGVGRGAHAASRHERRPSIGYLQTLVSLRAAPSCWCISSLARGLSYRSPPTSKPAASWASPSGRCSENCHTASPASLEKAFVCYPIRPPAWGSPSPSMRRRRGRCLSLLPLS